MFFVRLTKYLPMQVLMKSDLKVTLESGRFPRTCASIRKWIARRAFIRTVHMIVHVRRAQVNYHKMTKEEFKAERARLLRIAVPQWTEPKLPRATSL